MVLVSKNTHCDTCESRPLGVLCDLKQEALKEFEEKKITNIYKKGQMLFYEGNQPFGLYCVYQGRIKLYRSNPEGKVQILRILGPGDLLGYRSLLAEDTYRASAEILEDAVICFIEKHIFLNLLFHDPALAKNIMRKLSRELGEAEDLATSLAQKTAKSRVAELLLRLEERYGKVGGLQLSREEMACMTGLSSETVIRLLAEFKRKGWIKLEERQVEILDSVALQESIQE